MRNIWVKTVAATSICILVNAAPLTAGGLANQIVEAPQVVAPAAPVTEAAMPGWVLPAVGLLLLGAVAASAGGGDGDGDGDDSSDDGDDDSIIVDPK
ncbi:hypothetical protein BC777_2739 [Yoonia maricola]|uniref:Secreted protein n=1 Tax=Yoonia maricola TaxID=420999 RepID=A0A2M8W627_9RHOB|nr:hypothetical protein [Yoonia maricola]PJI86370.1 hypothetical protein BC777_2739 [Yoonia maricola]